METVGSVLNAVHDLANPRIAYRSFDNVGLLVGDPARAVKKCVLTLDTSLACIEFARSVGADLVVAHHPVIFQAVRSITCGDYTGRRVLALVEANLACICAHTNWDAAVGGVNDVLAGLLGLTDVKPFGYGEPQAHWKLIVFAPESHKNALVNALSQAGAGRIGDYSGCAFTNPGEGEFVPGENSSPTVGTRAQRNQVEEVRIEMLVSETARAAVETALHATHPYETPAFDVIPLEPRPTHRGGRMGQLPSPRSLSELLSHVRKTIGPVAIGWGDREIQTLAVVGGGADDEWGAALAAGADAFLTGEVKQHNAVEAVESGLTMVEAGHYHTEHPAMEVMAELLALKVPAVEFIKFIPAPGQAGRPLG
ncbi:MAG: Nif3-like dinuclear metal center hexameric protein [Armatimonadetes bacterium]|nr:Nif3-like dinuclear metal center hexameric protein [Armatimonadota bacterium]